jgi:hypothetical protein
MRGQTPYGGRSEFTSIIFSVIILDRYHSLCESNQRFAQWKHCVEFEKMKGYKASATKAQLNYIQLLMDQEGYDNDDLFNIYGKEIEDLTKEEASGMINWLKGEAKPANNPLVKRALEQNDALPKRVYILDREKIFKR